MCDFLLSDVAFVRSTRQDGDRYDIGLQNTVITLFETIVAQYMLTPSSHYHSKLFQGFKSILFYVVICLIPSLSYSPILVSVLSPRLLYYPIQLTVYII